jgi:hypothetical protein
MANPWLSHVKKTMKQMKSKGTYKKGDGLKKVIMAAKKTYKGGATGNVAVPASPVNAAAGGRRRTRRHSRK